MQKRRPRSRRKAKAAKKPKPERHKFGQFRIPPRTRVTGFGDWRPTDGLSIESELD